jgi:AcrR family transcriptional regulator
MGNSTDTVPFRERKKARTRRELAAIADRLFMRQGFDETTLEQIAQEANVSVRTVSRYFESKTRLALEEQYDTLNAFRARLQDPERDVDTLTCWRELLGHWSRSLEVKGYARHQAMYYKVPALVAGLIEISFQYEEAVMKALATDAGVDPEVDLRPRLLAVMIVSGTAAVIRHWLTEGLKGDVGANCQKVVDVAMEGFPEFAVGFATSEDKSR